MPVTSAANTHATATNAGVVAVTPAPELPGWVGRLLGLSDVGIAPWRVGEGAGVGEIETVLSDAGDVALLTATVRRATELDAAGLSGAVCAAYRGIGRRLAGLRAEHPIRFWNFIPGIHAPMGCQTRYMVFNAGRFAALASAEGPAGDRPAFATATGVGWGGSDLVIHCLSATRPGVPIENPRQIPAYRYSARYGARPPCFARATSAVLRPGAAPSLLLAGTASVVGEESRHEGDLGGQIAETFTNLDALLGVWVGSGEGGGERRISSLRVYHVRERGAQRIVDAVQGRYAVAAVIETTAAEICRPELLVEIEGVVGAPEGLLGEAAT